MLYFTAHFLRLILTLVLGLVILGYLDWFLWELVAVVFGKHKEDAAQCTIFKLVAFFIKFFCEVLLVKLLFNLCEDL